MDELDTTIKELFLQTERNFDNHPISSYGSKKRLFTRWVSVQNISIAAMFLLLVICLWAFAIPEILVEGVSYSMEVFTKKISSIYLELSIS